MDMKMKIISLAFFCILEPKCLVNPQTGKKENFFIMQIMFYRLIHWDEYHKEFWNDST